MFFPLAEQMALDNVDSIHQSLATCIDAVRTGDVEIVRAVSSNESAMIAVRCTDQSVEATLNSSTTEAASALAVNRVIFVQWHDVLERFIANAFSHVDVQRVDIEHDPIVDGPIAKVIVNDEQLSDAIGASSVFPRLAAMLTATDIEIVLPHETAGQGAVMRRNI
jgi:transcription antitermination factor NusA-like protein